MIHSAGFIRWYSEKGKALAGPIRSCSWLVGRILKRGWCI